MAKRRFRVAMLAGAVLSTAVVAVVWTSSAQAASTLPAGFILKDIPTGLKAPTSDADFGDMLTDFGFLPDDGGIISVGKNGRMMWSPAEGAPRQMAWPTTRNDGDLGMTGFAVAPDYRTSHTVYTVRDMPTDTPGAGSHGLFRLSKWTVTLDAQGNPAGLANEKPLVEATADIGTHGMTGVVAADDGTVWLSNGDNAHFAYVDPVALRASNLDDLHGKLIHVTQDGAGVPTNPYYDPAAPKSVRSRIYASGLRSPFRFSLDPTSGRPILGDVGWNTYEEINLIAPGSTNGWPCWEGNAKTPGYSDLPECAGKTSTTPMLVYPRTVGASVTGGIIYTGSAYPAQYKGRYFFGDYARNRIWSMRFDQQGTITTPPESPSFGENIGSPVKFAAMPDSGDIVFADISTATLRRLVYAPGNNPPSPSFTSQADPETRTVKFDASATTDPNGDQLTYLWDFGDGTTATSNTALTEHVYAAGVTSATVVLTVTDSLGASATKTSTIQPANHPPVITLNSGRSDQTFAVGDNVTASATATDAEDGVLPASGIVWTVNLVHCRPTGCHNHPGLRQTGGQFTLPYDDHPGDTTLVVGATATDSTGATTSKTFTALPRQARVSVQSTSPAVFSLGGEETTSSLFTVGSTVSIVAPAAAQDEVATFVRWSDGNTNRVRNIVVSDTDTTLTAEYRTPMDQRYAAEPALRSMLGAPTGVEQGDAKVRWREFANGRLYWNRAQGVHAVFGAILDRYIAETGHLKYGVPTTDEMPGGDGKGRYSHFEKGSILWSPTTGAHGVFGLIWTTYGQLGYERGIGYPTIDETVTIYGTGTYIHFQYGSIFWSPASGAFTVQGAIRDAWAGAGWERSPVGYPITNESPAAGGAGRYNDFQYGSIYWSPNSGTHFVYGAIRGTWLSFGGAGSFMGFPVTDEKTSLDGVGRYSHFQNASIFWAPGVGAYEVHGAIRAAWGNIGAERSNIGYPTTNETLTIYGTGTYNHFQRGSIFWSPNSGAHVVFGAIRNTWASMGWERSWLGYPTSDEFGVSGGRRVNFQGGYLEYRFSSGQVIAKRY